MDALRLQNFRCIEDSGTIELKPLNFLAGSNSSGKSSFLKFFPLIKQSIGQRKKVFFFGMAIMLIFKIFQPLLEMAR